jgi:hypothetical protein
MAGQTHLLIAAAFAGGALLFPASNTAGAQGNGVGGGGPSPGGPGMRGQRPPGAPVPGPRNNPAIENVRRALQGLTPEQRKRFEENFVRWSNLSPAEKKILAEREEMRKKFIEQEITAAIAESGLQLEGERRQQFIRRYGEERRKIEEQLHQETMARRKPLVRDLIARLKKEFTESKP